MRDFTSDIAEVARRVGEAQAYLKIAGLRVRLVELEVEVAKPDLWNDQEYAKRVNSEYASVRSDLVEFDRLAQVLEDMQVLHEMPAKQMMPRRNLKLPRASPVPGRL